MHCRSRKRKANRGNLKNVTQAEKMEIYARIGSIKPSVGHVLKLITHADVGSDIPIQAGMRAELEISTEIEPIKFVTGEDGRIGAAREREWATSTADHERGAQEKHSGRVGVALQYTRGRIESHLERPVLIKSPPPWQVGIEEDICLVHVRIPHF